jgi:RHS repeat-associated protein
MTDLAGYDYTYDAANRITSIDSLIDGLSEYVHDNAGQLTGAEHYAQANEAYEYDDNGNRIMTGHVVGANNRISSDGVHDYEYDHEGNMIARESIATGERIEYEWDHRNRLVRVVFKDEYEDVTQIVEQSYDVFNRWVRSQVDADGDEDFDSERFFAYDGNQVVLEFDGDSAADLTRRYLWGPAVDQILADERATSLAAPEDILWPLTDHLNTTRDLAEYDSLGEETAIASHRVFDSFGNLISESDPAVATLLGFTARPFDTATDLQWNLNRWYLSSLGVWMSEDPIGFAAGDGNLRRYVRNNSLASIDPRGTTQLVAAILAGRAATAEALSAYSTISTYQNILNPGPGEYFLPGTSKDFSFKVDRSNINSGIDQAASGFSTYREQGNIVTSYYPTKIEIEARVSLGEYDALSYDDDLGTYSQTTEISWHNYDRNTPTPVFFAASFSLTIDRIEGWLADETRVTATFPNGSSKTQGDYGDSVEVTITWQIRVRIHYASESFCFSGFSQGIPNVYTAAGPTSASSWVVVAEPHPRRTFLGTFYSRQSSNPTT